MSQLPPEKVAEINQLIDFQKTKIAAQESKITAINKRIERAKGKEEYQNTYSHKHKAAKKKVDDLRTELDIDRALLNRMKDKLEELGWMLTPEPE